MPINAKKPIVRPRVELDNLWMQKIQFNFSEVNGEGWAEITLVPYNAAGVVSYAESRVVRFDNVKALIAAGNIKLKKALEAIEDAVQQKENA